jgi:rSAM/selenodomain-associated transferase 2/rSAM/selenodomain-associated transferase 1
MIPALGAEGAAELHREMTEYTLESVRQLAGSGWDLEVRFAGGSREEMAGWLGDDLSCRDQGEGDLGERMKRAFEEAFAAGFEKAVIIGTDCPALTADDIQLAGELLDDNPMVLGPATDGGYYLIALRSDTPQVVFDRIFSGIEWGSSTVFSETMNQLADTMVDVGLLDDKDDVDEPSDLIYWELVRGSAKNEERSSKDSEHLKISVVIPVLNEEGSIGEVIERLKRTDVEIVIADGGSADGTVAICEDEGVRVVRSDPGRAGQMNAGAAASSGEILLFLHADTRLPEKFPALVSSAVYNGAAAGAFSFELDDPGLFIVAGAAHFRSHRLGVVFGDQAIFAARKAFAAAGGYPDQPVMEDYELWRRLKKQGPRVILPEVAITSARRWREFGAWRVSFANQVVTWGYVIFHVSPHKLAEWYGRFLHKHAEHRTQDTE